MSELLTPSQTVGPYFSMRLPWPGGPFVVPAGTPGAVTIIGRLHDGAGDPVSDGSFTIVTLKPGPLPSGDGRTQAPHIDVSVFSRGMLDRSVTRIYFPGETAANDADPVLAAVPAGRRATLIAVPAGDGLLRFDIHLQGPHETVFFDL